MVSVSSKAVEEKRNKEISANPHKKEEGKQKKIKKHSK